MVARLGHGTRFQAFCEGPGRVDLNIVYLQGGSLKVNGGLITPSIGVKQPPVNHLLFGHLYGGYNSIEN